MDEEKSNTSDSERLKIILEYVQMIPNRFHMICKGQKALQNRLDVLEIKIMQLGEACKKAFHQTKDCVNFLATTQEELNSDIAEYGGIIQSSSFFGQNCSV